MAIWWAPFTPEELNRTRRVGLAAQLGVAFSAAGEDWLAATLPVDARTRQPYGLLHGGVSLALAGTVGVTAAQLCVDPARAACRLLEINGNHLRGVREGPVTATARPLHLGRRSQVWQVELVDPAGRVACSARLTVAVEPAR